MYYIWKSNFENEKAYTRANIVNLKGLKHIKLTACQPLTGALPNITLKIETPFPPTDYFNAGPLFIASEKLSNLLKGIKVNAEFHQVTLVYEQSSHTSEPYYFVNLLDKVDCLDSKNSIYTLDGGYINRIQKLVIDEKKIGLEPLFRLGNCYDVIILANQELFDSIQINSISGVKLQKPEDWKW